MVMTKLVMLQLLEKQRYNLLMIMMAMNKELVA